jgi:hypothetical protein
MLLTIILILSKVLILLIQAITIIPFFIQETEQGKSKSEQFINKESNLLEHFLIPNQ